MNSTLLDTDTLSEILRRRDPVVATKAAEYLKQHSEFAFSAITNYEIVRGLTWRNAQKQLVAYREFAARSLVLPISDDVFEQAAMLWAEGRRSGRPHRDADLIIAATAILHGRTLVTGNTPHFDWIPCLSIANWRIPGQP
jgi:tRNA(fMet)-specific endonuclease VapC